MEIFVEINDLPGFEGIIKRKALVKDFRYFPLDRYLTLNLEIRFYKATPENGYGDEVNSTQIQPKQDCLKADNFTNFLLPDNTDTGLTEIVFWENMAQNPISFFDQITNSVQLAASRGRFN